MSEASTADGRLPPGQIQTHPTAISSPLRKQGRTLGDGHLGPTSQSGNRVMQQSQQESDEANEDSEGNDVDVITVLKFPG